MRRTPGIFRARQGRRVLDALNAIRKVAIAATKGSDWGILGYEFEDIETGTATCEGEGDEPIPVFQGIGIFGRPLGAKAEGVMLHVGNQADHPLLVAVRDEDGRRAYVEAFGEVVGGEVAIFNAQGTARILIAADGSIEINSSADVNIRNNGDPVDSFVKRSEFLLHGHPTAGTGPPSGPTTFAGAGPTTPGVPLEFAETKLKGGDE